MEVAFQNLFGVGSDRGGFQAFSTSRLQLIQHNFAKGRPSGAPGFLARAKFLTFAIFERVPNAERQHIIEAQRTVGRLLHRLFWPRPLRNCAHPPHFFQKRGLPNVFPDGKVACPVVPGYSISLFRAVATSSGHRRRPEARSAMVRASAISSILSGPPKFRPAHRGSRLGQRDKPHGKSNLCPKLATRLDIFE